MPDLPKITNDQIKAVVRAYWQARSQASAQLGIVTKLNKELEKENKVLEKLLEDEIGLEELLDILDPKWHID